MIPSFLHHCIKDITVRVGLSPAIQPTGSGQNPTNVGVSHLRTALTWGLATLKKSTDFCPGRSTGLSLVRVRVIILENLLVCSSFPLVSFQERQYYSEGSWVSLFKQYLILCMLYKAKHFFYLFFYYFILFISCPIPTCRLRMALCLVCSVSDTN